METNRNPDKSSFNSKYALLTLGFVAFVTSFGAHVVAVNLPIYARQIGVGMAMIGALIAVYDLAEIFAKPVFGFLAGRSSLKATMLGGLAFFSLASLSYLFVDPHLLILVRFLQGLGAAALSITSAALVAEYYPTSRGRAFGIYNSIKGAGYALSPVIGGALVARTRFSMIFVASAIAGALAFTFSVALPPSRKMASKDEDDDLSFRALASVFPNATLLPWYGVIVANMFMVGILFGFLPVYVSSLGYGQLKNGLVVGAATAAYLLVQPIAGSLADNIDPERLIFADPIPPVRLIFAGLAFSSVGIGLIPFTKGGALVAAVVLAGIGVGTVWTNTDAMVSNLAHEGRIAATLGAAGSFKELGDMLGPLVIGSMSQLLGLKWGFVICGLLGVLALLLLRSSALPSSTAETPTLPVKDTQQDGRP